MHAKSSVSLPLSACFCQQVNSISMQASQAQMVTKVAATQTMEKHSQGLCRCATGTASKASLKCPISIRLTSLNGIALLSSRLPGSSPGMPHQIGQGPRIVEKHRRRCVHCQRPPRLHERIAPLVSWSPLQTRQCCNTYLFLQQSDTRASGFMRTREPQV